MPDGRENLTILGADVVIKGELSFSGTARILGTVEGAITATGTVQIEPGASVKASVDAANIIVDGGVEGDLTATERLQLSARANVKGDLVAKSLSVLEGATFSGHVSVGPEALNGPKVEKAAEKFGFGKLPKGKAKVDAEWLPESSPARTPEWANSGANGAGTSKPAWMAGGEVEKGQ